MPLRPHRQSRRTVRRCVYSSQHASVFNQPKHWTQCCNKVVEDLLVAITLCNGLLDTLLPPAVNVAVLCYRTFMHLYSPCFFALHGTLSTDGTGSCSIWARFFTACVPLTLMEWYALLRLQSSSGTLLVPPVGGSARLAELGPLLPHDILLEGNTWKESSVDVAIAGPVSIAAYFLTFSPFLCGP